MDWAVGAAWIAAVVALISTAVTLYLQWWNRPEVRWLCDGYASLRRSDDRYSSHSERDRIVARLQLVNCGDAPAYGVETLRSNGEPFETFAVFEEGIVPPGGTIDVTVAVATEHWDTCWVEPRYRQGPTSRSKELRSGPRFFPSQVLGNRNRLAPGFDPTSPGPGRRAPDLDPGNPQD